MKIFVANGDSRRATFSILRIKGESPFLKGEIVDCRIETTDPSPRSRERFVDGLPSFAVEPRPSDSVASYRRAMSFPIFEVDVAPPEYNGCITRKKPSFLDCHYVYGHHLGFNSCVSQRCADILAPHVGHNCRFIPLDVPGAPFPYYVLWVTTVADVLDEDASAFGVPRTDGFKTLIRAKFKPAAADALLFRLPGGRYFGHDEDYASEAFVDLCQHHRLTGFEFMEAYTAEFIEMPKASPRK